MSVRQRMQRLHDLLHGGPRPLTYCPTCGEHTWGDTDPDRDVLMLAPALECEACKWQHPDPVRGSFDFGRTPQPARLDGDHTGAP